MWPCSNNTHYSLDLVINTYSYTNSKSVTDNTNSKTNSKTNSVSVTVTH